MNVNHLLILYPDGRDADSSGETGNSADALLHKQLAKIERLAEALAIKEGAQSKARTGSMMSANVVRFDSANEKLRFIGPKVEKGKLTDKELVKAQVSSNSKALDKAKSDAKSVLTAVKEDAKKGHQAQTPTWGVYVVIHGLGGEPSLKRKMDPEYLAALIKNAAPRGDWRLKKVCIVGCTLGHVPVGKTDSYVKMVCDELKLEGALVGGYTAQVFVAAPGHIATTPSISGYVHGTPAIGFLENKGRKFVELPKDHPSRVNDTDGIERMTDEFRATYKVAWRWNGNASEKVDVMKEWYHQ